jgi:hypothetical protein
LAIGRPVPFTTEQGRLPIARGIPSRPQFGD